MNDNGTLFSLTWYTFGIYILVGSVYIDKVTIMMVTSSIIIYFIYHNIWFLSIYFFVPYRHFDHRIPLVFYRLLSIPMIWIINLFGWFTIFVHPHVDALFESTSLTLVAMGLVHNTWPGTSLTPKIEASLKQEWLLK